MNHELKARFLRRVTFSVSLEFVTTYPGVVDYERLSSLIPELEDLVLDATIRHVLANHPHQPDIAPAITRAGATWSAER